ncbi:hypothetical protein FKM82_026186 [Ascaphus truei]
MLLSISNIWQTNEKLSKITTQRLQVLGYISTPSNSLIVLFSESTSAGVLNDSPQAPPTGQVFRTIIIACSCIALLVLRSALQRHFAGTGPCPVELTIYVFWVPEAQGDKVTCPRSQGADTGN